MKKILLVEDNLEVRENTAEILELSGYEVLTAENGKVGVQLAQANDPDLIICDIMMPELDGYGVLRILNKDPNTAQIPFIFLTAKAEMSDMRKGMNLGADDYLTKPFDEVELLDAIELRLAKFTKSQEPFSKDAQGLSHFMDQARSHNSLEHLSEDRELRQYKAKDLIFEEEGHPHYLYFIISGKVRTFKSNPDAKDLILNLHSAGDFLGYEALLTEANYGHSAAAMDKTEVALIPKADFFALLYNNRDIANAFIRMLAGDVKEKESQLLHLAYDTVRKRVADALLSFKNEFHDTGELTFSMRIPRENLAAMVGTSKECVIRVLSDFKADNIVSTYLSDITILDEDKLKAVRW
ncbi:MAG: response regulator [Bacteroidota bacterium]